MVNYLLSLTCLNTAIALLLGCDSGTPGKWERLMFAADEMPGV
jgi:hypothetical protein